MKSLGKDKFVKLSKCITPVFETPSKTGSWFGYYNYDTLNYDQTKILATRTQHDAEYPQKGYIVEVGYYDLQSGVWNKVGISDSYNWPQGCMAQWLPGKGNENKIIYNTSDGEKNISMIIDIESKEKKIINWSIYGLTPDGKKSISLIMERSHWCRAYHYESISDSQYDGQIFADDGIYEIDLEHNIRKKLISIQDIMAIDYEPYFEKAKHWLEHIMVSPNGKRFCFLHRFTTHGLNDYETRLFIANIDGSNLQCVEGWRNYCWSHFGWNGDDAFVIYTYESLNHNKIVAEYEKGDMIQSRKTNMKRNLRVSFKKIYHIIPFNIIPFNWKTKISSYIKGQHRFYQYYKISEEGIQLKKQFDQHIFSIDGHPSFTNDGKYMITDTYPLPNQFQRLLIFNTYNHKWMVLGQFYAGLHMKPGTCDLHPKLCKNNKYVAVDSAYDGQHHIVLFSIKWDDIKRVIG